ncbi:uncharacterized protein LOC135708670 [Ochlerotatus camptorhynchus]|uniref:uncharacterized protein LOC135708670 n=1 Tax=Ochlerotatus camptorhynchus TaxID=644619 RepID=UPI0031D2F63A
MQYFWTDSKICLSWLKTSQKLTAYVGSRVMKIKENGHGDDLWHWVPSQLNVADLATKSSKFGCMQEWLKGANFLYRDSVHWPNNEPLEMSSYELINFHTEVIADVSLDPMCCTVVEVELVDLPDIERFSDFNRLIRSTAYYLKMRKILALPKCKKPKCLTISVNDMDEAKSVWYRKVQSQIFCEELRSLKQTGFVKSNSRLKTYSPFLENGIIRMRGRVQDDGKSFEVNNPVILPNNHQFSTLLIRMYHIANAHQGMETVVNNIKERHRILKIRSQVKKYTMSCVKCRELRAKPTVPLMGNLPPERTTPFVFPFTYTGSCIMAIRCFMSIRGLPQCFMTDNGTNFTGADAELKKLVRTLDQRQIEDSLSIYADRFWRRWIASFRPELIRSRKWPDSRNYHDYHVGDLVMIVDESLHRGSWPKGVVEKIYQGPDGKAVQQAESIMIVFQVKLDSITVEKMAAGLGEKIKCRLKKASASI